MSETLTSVLQGLAALGGLAALVIVVSWCWHRARLSAWHNFMHGIDGKKNKEK